MYGCFTQRYAWREIHDSYDLTAAARNLQAHYNIAPTNAVEVVRTPDCVTELAPMRWGTFPGGGKKAVETAACDLQCASGYDAWARREATVFHQCRGLQRAELCGPVGSMKESQGPASLWRRAQSSLRRQRADAANSRPHAGGPRQGRFRGVAWRGGIEFFARKYSSIPSRGYGTAKRLRGRGQARAFFPFAAREVHG